MAAKIHPQLSKWQSLLEGKFGLDGKSGPNPQNISLKIFSNLTIREQVVASSCTTGISAQVNKAQREELTQRFPKEHLALAGGDLTKVAMRNIRQVDSATLAKLPNVAMGWVQITPLAWTLYLFKREVTHQGTQENRVLYYFSQLPDFLDQIHGVDSAVPEEQWGTVKYTQIPARLKAKEKGAPPVPFELEKEPVRAKVGFWEILTPPYARQTRCTDICTCNCCFSRCVESFCIPWTCWFKLSFNCGCNETFKVEDFANQQAAKDKVGQSRGRGHYSYDEFSYNGAHYFPIAFQVNYYDSYHDPVPDSLATRYAIVRYDTALPHPIKFPFTPGSVAATKSNASAIDEEEEEYSETSSQVADFSAAPIPPQQPQVAVSSDYKQPVAVASLPARNVTVVGDTEVTFAGSGRIALELSK